MIPDYVSDKTRSPAERDLFERFEELDMPGYVCLHSLNLPVQNYQDSGEIDFVVVGPPGLFAIEVKGGRVSCKAGRWTSVNRSGLKQNDLRNPFNQASSGMHTLRNRLEKLLEPQDFRLVLTGFGVAFPDGPFQINSVEHDLTLVLDSERLLNDGLKAYIESLAEIWHTRFPGKSRDLPKSIVERIVHAMRPQFDMVQSLQMRYDRIEREQVRLTDDQYRHLDTIRHHDRILVEGGAGTGKTFLATAIARRHAANGQRVLLVCLSPVLAAYLRSVLDSERIVVVSVPDLMVYTVRKHGTLPPGYRDNLPVTDEWYRGPLTDEFERVTRHLEDSERFDVLIIDEAQDVLNYPYLIALGNILRGGLDRGIWRIFYDPLNQGALFGHLDRDVLAELRSGHPQNPRLLTNCRNTPQIVLQTKLNTGADIGIASLGHGVKVEYVFYNDRESAARLLENELRILRGKQIDDRTITILSPLPFEQSSVALLPAAWQQRIHRLDRPENHVFPFKSITFSTVADFKGLENRVILLTDIDELDESEYALATVYVGMTRACVQLWMAINEREKERLLALSMRHLEASMKDMKHDR